MQRVSRWIGTTARIRRRRLGTSRIKEFSQIGQIAVTHLPIIVNICRIQAGWSEATSIEVIRNEYYINGIHRKIAVDIAPDEIRFRGCTRYATQKSFPAVTIGTHGAGQKI